MTIKSITQAAPRREGWLVSPSTGSVLFSAELSAPLHPAHGLAVTGPHVTIGRVGPAEAQTARPCTYPMRRRQQATGAEDRLWLKNLATGPNG